jgi:hypothetical protein
MAGKIAGNRRDLQRPWRLSAGRRGRPLTKSFVTPHRNHSNPAFMRKSANLSPISLIMCDLWMIDGVQQGNTAVQRQYC